MDLADSRRASGDASGPLPPNYTVAEQAKEGYLQAIAGIMIPWLRNNPSTHRPLLESRQACWTYMNTAVDTLIPLPVAGPCFITRWDIARISIIECHDSLHKFRVFSITFNKAHHLRFFPDSFSVTLDNLDFMLCFFLGFLLILDDSRFAPKAVYNL